MADELSFTLSRAGPILGASFIHVAWGERDFHPVYRQHRPPELPRENLPARLQEADYIVIESTYGDCLHGSEDAAEQIA